MCWANRIHTPINRPALEAGQSGDSWSWRQVCSGLGEDGGSAALCEVQPWVSMSARGWCLTHLRVGLTSRTHDCL